MGGHAGEVGCLLWGDRADTPVSVTETGLLRLERDGDGAWRLAGPQAGEFALVNDYLGYLADRNYSPRTVRAYGFDLLAFCRWLAAEEISLDAVTTEVMLEFLRACRQAPLPGRPAGNVVSMTGQRLDRYAATTINHRLAAVTGLFGSGRCGTRMRTARCRRAGRRGS
jgi:integrase/recombinase XerD